MSTDLEPRITDAEVAALPLAEARADLLRELLADPAAPAAPRRGRRLLLVAAAVLVLLVAVPLALRSSGGDGSDVGVATDPGPTAPPPAFQLRVTDGVAGRPCPAPPVVAAPEEPAVACDEAGVAYDLDPAFVAGGVTGAEAFRTAGRDATWAVSVELDGAGAAALARVSRGLVGTADRLAVVLDGVVLTAPMVAAPLTTGELQLAGTFDRQEATDLAARLDSLASAP